MVNTVENHQAKAQDPDKNDCVICGTIVQSSALAVQCDQCDLWTHCSCGSISTTLYRCLTTSKTKMIKIKCMKCIAADCQGVASSEVKECLIHDPVNDTLNEMEVTCVPAASPTQSTPANSPRKLTDIASLHENTSPIRSFADAVARNIPTKVKTRPKKVRLQEVISRLTRIENGLINPSTSKIIPGKTKVSPRPTHQEGVEPQPPLTVPPGKNRRQCLILMNIPESNATTAQDRVDHDVLLVRECLQKLFTPDEEPIAKNIRPMNIYRLGKRADEKTRPLKIVLSSEKDVDNMLARSHRLKGLPVRILRDLSPEDRIRLKEAINELREKRATGDNDWIIRDFRLTRRRPRIKWHPLQLQALPGNATSLALHRTELISPHLNKNLGSLCIPTPAVL